MQGGVGVNTEFHLVQAFRASDRDVYGPAATLQSGASRPDTVASFDAPGNMLADADSDQVHPADVV